MRTIKSSICIVNLIPEGILSVGCGGTSRRYFVNRWGTSNVLATLLCPAHLHNARANLLFVCFCCCCFQNQAPEETSPHLLPGAQDQRLGAEQDQLPQEPLLATVKRRKVAWFGHVTRHDSLSKTIVQGTLVGGRRRGRQRKCWMDKIKERTS